MKVSVRISSIPGYEFHYEFLVKCFNSCYINEEFRVYNNTICCILRSPWFDMEKFVLIERKLEKQKTKNKFIQV
jgi:hypothetical protein